MERRKTFRGSLWSKSSIAPVFDPARQTFRVTHPFHPWKGREFSLVSYHKHWAGDRVFFDNGGNGLISLPVAWTDVLPPDPLVALSQERSPFRADDLRELAELLRRIDPESRPGVAGDV